MLKRLVNLDATRVKDVISSTIRRHCYTKPCTRGVCLLKVVISGFLLRAVIPLWIIYSTTRMDKVLQKFNVSERTKKTLR